MPITAEVEQELDRMRAFRTWLNYRQHRYSVTAIATIIDADTGIGKAALSLQDKEGEGDSHLGLFNSVDQALQKIDNDILLQAWRAETRPRKPIA